MEPKLQEQLRSLPGIDRVADQLDELPLDVGLKTALVRRVVERIRQEIRTGSSSRFEERDLSAEGVANQVRAYYQDLTQLRPQVVINATGVLVHTNLGRSPLSPKAVQHIAALGGKYSDLEFDLQSGGRGSRQSHVTELLCLLTGAEDALVVNNCAAAVYLMLAGLSHDKEVVISRGELVEIGGSFRIPDVLRHSGAKLREVGTTNRTHLKDFVEAITEDTGLLLQVHTSNYRVEGFTAAVPLSDLAELGAKKRIPVAVDLGSGAFFDLTDHGLKPEPQVRQVLEAGASVVAFSGDKLLGGPQAGILVGKKAALEPLKKHPMARAVRIDKLLLAALQATLVDHLNQADREANIPVLRMLQLSPEAVRERAEDWARQLKKESHLQGVKIEVESAISPVGGGSVPGEGVSSFVLKLTPAVRAMAWQKALLQTSPALVTRLQKESLCLDPRTVDPEEDATVVSLLVETFSSLEDGTKL